MYAQQALTIKPSKIEAGKDIRFTYTGKLAKADTKVTVILMTLNNNIPVNIETELKGNKLEWKLTVPDSIGYVGYTIRNTNESDNNNFLYGFNVYKKGKLIRGSYLLQAVFNIMGVGLDNPKNADRAVELMEKDYNLNPELEEHGLTNIRYLEILSKTTNRKREVSFMANRLFEKAMQTGANDKAMLAYLNFMYSNPVDAYKIDSTTTEVAKLYPKSVLGFYKRVREFNDTESPDKVFELYDALLKDFPGECKKVENKINHTLTIAYRKKKDFVNFEYYLDKIQDDPGFQAEQLNTIAWDLASKNQELSIAKMYSERSLACINSLSKTEKPANFDSLKDWSEFISVTTGNYYDTYASILSKLGLKQTAVEMQQKAVELMAENTNEINERLIQYLIENNQPKDALAKAKEFMIVAKTSSKIDSLYAAAYIAENGSLKGIKETKDDIKKQMKQAPDFSLKTMEGKLVTLSDFKSKIVIIFFCAVGPDLSTDSFQGMQKSIETLKQRDDVHFLFVNNYENDSAKVRFKEIMKSLEKKQARFDILLHEKIAGSFLVGKLYDVEYVPSLIIIDKSGRIYNKRTIDYNNNEELVKEIKSIADILK